MSFEDFFESESAFNGALVGVFIGIVAAVVAVLVVYYRKKSRDDKSPVQTVSAKIVSMRPYVNRPNTAFYVMFEFSDGGRQELLVSPEASSVMAVNDMGTLTYQGTRFKKFERSTV